MIVMPIDQNGRDMVAMAVVGQDGEKVAVSHARPIEVGGDDGAFPPDPMAATIGGPTLLEYFFVAFGADDEDHIRVLDALLHPGGPADLGRTVFIGMIGDDLDAPVPEKAREPGHPTAEIAFVGITDKDRRLVVWGVHWRFILKFVYFRVIVNGSGFAKH